MTKYTKNPAIRQTPKPGKHIDRVGLTIVELYTSEEVQELKNLYNKKCYQLEKAEQGKDCGLIIILDEEVKAIKRALLAFNLLAKTYHHREMQFSQKIESISKEKQEAWQHLNTICIGAELITELPKKSL